MADHIGRQPITKVLPIQPKEMNWDTAHSTPNKPNKMVQVAPIIFLRYLE